MAKTRTLVTIILCIFLLASVAAAYLWLRPAGGHVARVYVDGELLYTIDLDALTERKVYTVKTDRGVNVVVAEPGRIRVESADCPDQVCVDFGWLSDSAAPIVCLPHRLVIRLSGDASVDAEVGG